MLLNEYPLSATIRPGKRLGLPRPTRLIELLFHQLLEHGSFMLLARSEYKRYWLAFTFTSDMYLGAEPSSAPT